MPLLDLDFTTQAFQTALESSCSICVMGLSFAFIFSFPHISVSGGVLVQLEKLLTAKRIRADISPCQLWHCYLPESTQSKGGIRGRGWWESVCATSSQFTKADHCWRSTWSQLQTPRGSFSCPLSALPLCQIFKVCNEAVVIYSSLPFCPSDCSVLYTIQFYTHSSWVII